MTKLPLAAQDAPLPELCILPFDGAVQSTREEEDITAMRAIAEETFIELGKFSITSLEDMNKFLFINEISLKDLYQPSVIKKIAERDINYVLTGDVDALEKSYRLKLYFLDVENQTFITSKGVKLKKNGPSLKNGVIKLVRQFTAHKSFKKIVAPVDEASDSTSDSTAAAQGTVYAVGDIGPAGGIIFYAKPQYSDGWRYLEALPVDLPDVFAWGFYYDDSWSPTLMGTGTAVGEGKRNTDQLLGADTFKNQVNAMRACFTLEYKGFSGWFLPSKDELDALYRTLVKKGFGNFNRTSYWSSTQSTESTAWFQRFDDGKQYPNGRKTELLAVRPIRAF